MGKRQQSSKVEQWIQHPLKWPGRKSQALQYVRPYLASRREPKSESDKANQRIVEPFSGTGVVSINHPYRSKWSNDRCPAIYTFNRWLLRDPDALIGEAEFLWATVGEQGQGTEGDDEKEIARSGYLGARRTYNEAFQAGAVDSAASAAMTLFLNRFGFNGLYRVNLSGEYNVPYGWPAKKPSLLKERIMACHRALALGNTTVTSWDFVDVFVDPLGNQNFGEHDVVFCDPPYLGVSDTSNFTAYSNAWSDDKHVILDLLARDAARNGAAVVITASDTPASVAAYRNARVYTSYGVNRQISAKLSGRGKIDELMFVY